MLRSLLAAFLLAAVACHSSSPTSAASPPRLTIAEVSRLHHSRQYFELRDRLAHAPDASNPPVLLARAIVAHAMNRPAESNDALRRLERIPGLTDSVAADALELEISNDLRLSDWSAGARAVDALLSGRFILDSLRTADARNTLRIFHALAGTPAQSMTTTGPTSVSLVHGHIPLVVNDSTRDYVFDTGANLSTIMRSEAAAVGLHIIPAGIEVGTSTTARITADLGIADSIRIGAMHFHNVVFLVLDDALLTFPDGFHIPGIIGFPVIEQMGEIRLGHSTLDVPAVPPGRAQQNLVLDELTLLTPVRWQSRPLLCRLDTGAGRTQVYEPFYRRYRDVIDAGSDTATRKMGSAGGVEQTPVRVSPNVRLTVGDTVASLKTLDVLVHSIARDESSNYLDCNLGHDVFDQFGQTIVNFRDMAFLLR
ncbi:MAG: retropepsin-like aspartic protease [Gemmatimonadaceae bacterium]